LYIWEYLGFLEEENASLIEFYDACKETMDKKKEDGEFQDEYSWFLERLLASMDYKLFYGLMMNEARRQQAIRSRK